MYKLVTQSIFIELPCYTKEKKKRKDPIEGKNWKKFHWIRVNGSTGKLWDYHGGLPAQRLGDWNLQERTGGLNMCFKDREENKNDHQ